MSENIATNYHDDIELTSSRDIMSLYGNETSLRRLKMDFEAIPLDGEVNFDTQLEFTDDDSDLSTGSSFEGCSDLSNESQIAMKKQSHGKIKKRNVEKVLKKSGNTDKDQENIEKETFSEYNVKNRQFKLTDGSGEETKTHIDDREHGQQIQEDLSDLLIKKLQGIGKISSEKNSLNGDPLNIYDICPGKPSTLLQNTSTYCTPDEPMETPKQFVPTLTVEEMEFNGHQNHELITRNNEDGELKTFNSQKDGLRVPQYIKPSPLGSKTQRGKRYVKSAPLKGDADNESKGKLEKDIEKTPHSGTMQNNTDESKKNMTELQWEIEDKESEEIHSQTNFKNLESMELGAGKAEKTERNCYNGNTMPDKEESAISNTNPTILQKELKVTSEKEISSHEENNNKGKMDSLQNRQRSKRVLPSLASIVEMAYYNDDYFKRFTRQNLSEQRELKKHFKAKIAEAKKTLREARKKAQEQTVARRFDEAVRKHREMQKRRTSTRSSSTPASSVKQTAKPTDPKKRFIDASIEVTKKEKLEVREIHKAEAQLDRAKVAKKSKERLTRTSRLDLVSRPTSIKAKMRRDRERMERYEVEYLISELRYLNMEDYASKLIEALEFKEELEVTLRNQLAQKRKFAIEMAKRRKLEEQARIKDEERRRRLEEKERKERERKEREEIEREMRRKEALKRREQNLKLWELYNFTVLATDTSRSFTYSYLPALKTPVPVKEEKPKKIKLKHVKSRYMMQ